MPSPPAWIHSVGPLVAADLRRRYAGSLLGGLWAVLSPLLEVGAYALLFAFLVQPGEGTPGLSYALFVASGLLPWASLREALEGSAGVLPDNRWVRRSRVPVELLVARQTVASASRACVGLVLVVGAALLRGGAPGFPGVLLPFAALVLQVAAAHGLGLALAPLGVLHPDLRPGLASALTLLTFASPILYPESALAPAAARVLEWNPFTHFLRLYRSPLEGGAPVSSIAVVTLSAAGTLAGGSLLGRRLFWDARDRL
jgi:ABC-type polysaccharide/polyol phosphate export permease